MPSSSPGCEDQEKAHCLKRYTTPTIKIKLFIISILKTNDFLNSPLMISIFSMKHFLNSSVIVPCSFLTKYRSYHNGRHSSEECTIPDVNSSSQARIPRRSEE